MSKGRAYNFTCKKLNEFIFEIKWDVDYYLLDSTVTRGRVFTRFTDEKGALRFCKKHGIDFEKVLEKFVKKLEIMKDAGLLLKLIKLKS